MYDLYRNVSTWAGRIFAWTVGISLILIAVSFVLFVIFMWIVSLPHR